MCYMSIFQFQGDIGNNNHFGLVYDAWFHRNYTIKKGPTVELTHQLIFFDGNCLKQIYE